MKKGQPITARRVDEMGVRLPLEESPCPHRSSSSAFSTGVSSFHPLLFLPLSYRHYHPRSVSFYFKHHPRDSILSLSHKPTLGLLASRSPRLSFSFRSSCPILPSASRRNSLSRKKKKEKKTEPAKNRCWPPIGHVAGGSRPHWRSRTRGRGLKMSSRYVIAYIDPILGPAGGERRGHTPTLIHMHAALRGPRSVAS